MSSNLKTNKIKEKLFRTSCGTIRRVFVQFIELKIFWLRIVIISWLCLCVNQYFLYTAIRESFAVSACRAAFGCVYVCVCVSHWKNLILFIVTTWDKYSIFLYSSRVGAYMCWVSYMFICCPWKSFSVYYTAASLYTAWCWHPRHQQHHMWCIWNVITSALYLQIPRRQIGMIMERSLSYSSWLDI